MVLGTQLLTMLHIRRVEKCYVCSWEIHILQKLTSTFCRNLTKGEAADREQTHQNQMDLHLLGFADVLQRKIR